MADPSPAQPRPGPDQIILSPPGPGDLCSSLAHRRARRPALVITGTTRAPSG